MDLWLRESVRTSDLLTSEVPGMSEVSATVVLQVAAGTGEICCCCLVTVEEGADTMLEECKAAGPWALKPLASRCKRRCAWKGIHRVLW